MSTLRAYLESLPCGFVPSDLLSEVDTIANPAGARLFVTAVALGRPSSKIWTDLAITKKSSVSVLSILMDLKALGALVNIERVPGGYLVEEREIEA